MDEVLGVTLVLGEVVVVRFGAFWCNAHKGYYVKFRTSMISMT